MKPSFHPFDLLVGLDRADAKADLCLLDPHSGATSQLTLATDPDTLHAWLARFRADHPAARVALCVEQPALNLIAFLEAYSWITIFAINPLTLQKFREAFIPSRAKDDAKDAAFLAQLLLHHHDQLTRWAPEDSPTRRLSQLIVHRRGVVEERVGLTNRLQALLKQYFPQALTLCGEDLWRPLATDFLLRWPTLQAARRARPAALQRFYGSHGSRSQSLLEERLKLIAHSIPLTDEPALLETFARRVQLACRELQLVVQAIADYDRDIAAGFAAHPDREVFAALPGAGPVLAPRLLASLGSQRERFPTAASLQCYTGIAPVTKQSGGMRRVQRRYRCPKFLRQSFHEYAKESILHSRWAAAYHAQRRANGVPLHTVVRALAFQWQRILWKCWQTRTPYSEAEYEKALKRTSSPLAADLQRVAVIKGPQKQAGKKSKKTIVGSPQR